MAEMTAIERIDKHVRLEQPDRVGIAPFGEFYYGSLIGMSIEDMLMDPWKADEAFEAGFETRTYNICRKQHCFGKVYF